MEREERSCASCSRRFSLATEDLAFYTKVNVPQPTWCPECRSIRRFAWREDRKLHRATCALCGKQTLSVQSPAGPFTIYCRTCWKGDGWDSRDYGRDYDFSKPFFVQYRELMEAVPRPALTGDNLIESEYVHACLNVKKCYFVFWSYFTEDSMYSSSLLLSKSCMDAYITDNSDHAYEVAHGNRLYRVRFGYFADDCIESSFLYDCVGCSDSFGCVNMRKSQYCLWNEQLTKEEYREHIAYWDIGSYAKLQEAKQKFRELYLSVPHPYAHIVGSVNVTGDVIRGSKNSTMIFSALDNVEDCKYLYFGGLNLKDSYDVSYGGDTSELLYETVAITSSQRSRFSAGGSHSKDVQYSDWVSNSSDCFGCIGLNFKQYCILNKQYTKEEYEALLPKIIEHMNTMPYVDKQGRVYRYGEFFPTELSAYGYNESLAFGWYPKSAAEVSKEGWPWEAEQHYTHAVTLPAVELPDHIRDVPDTIVNEVIGCANDGGRNEQCSGAFRITREELAFYREMHVALPRLCPNCRHTERLTWRSGFTLYHRQCMCEGAGAKTYVNTVRHAHGSEACATKFETTTSPDRPEIVYCDACYKSEFLA